MVITTAGVRGEKKKKKNLHGFGGQSAGSAWEIFHLLDLTKVKALLCPTNQRARSLSLSLPLWHETRFIISLSHKIPFTVYSVKFLFPLFLSVCARAVRTAHIISMSFFAIINVSVAQCDSVWLWNWPGQHWRLLHLCTSQLVISFKLYSTAHDELSRQTSSYGYTHSGKYQPLQRDVYWILKGDT